MSAPSIRVHHDFAENDLAGGESQGGSAESITARYAKYAQRCIPRVHASAFSHGDHRTRIYVGKHRRERGRAFLPSHYLLARSLFLLFPSCPRSSRAFSRSLPLSFAILGFLLLAPAVDRPRTRRNPLLLFYSPSRPVIVDTMARNDCFTPPLARELGNKLAVGLISLSLPMAASPHA